MNKKNLINTILATSMALSSTQVNAENFNNCRVEDYYNNGNEKTLCLDLIRNKTLLKAGDEYTINWKQKGGIEEVSIMYSLRRAHGEWINFSLKVNPEDKIQSYTWKVPENLKGKNLTFSITGRARVPSSNFSSSISYNGRNRSVIKQFRVR